MSPAASQAPTTPELRGKGEGSSLSSSAAHPETAGMALVTNVLVPDPGFL